MKPKILAVIPARLSSSRFPGKVLYPINGRPLLEHLYNEISKAKLVDNTVVASDSDEVITAVKSFGGLALKTSKKHKTGSDRTSEAAAKLGGDIILNIQADCLGVRAADYDRILRVMISDKKIQYATLAKKIESESELFDPNRVKLIFDKNNNALWFSRYPLPYLQGVGKDRINKFNFYYHIGVYFFRKAALADFHKSPRTRYEKAESLEQLRILENKKIIRVFKIKSKLYSIDSPEDLKYLRE